MFSLSVPALWGQLSGAKGEGYASSHHISGSWGPERITKTSDTVYRKQGIDPSTISQCWLLCQSIARKQGPFLDGCFTDVKPHIAALAWKNVDAEHVVPCILPRGRLWLNKHMRFASGAELLQMQGVCIHSSVPDWKAQSDSFLERVAGNGFSLPIIG